MLMPAIRAIKFSAILSAKKARQFTQKGLLDQISHAQHLLTLGAAYGGGLRK
jgi:hypothetical protein